ncbi:MAG: tRNA pseudouridine(55) synthase TruB [Desulfobacteraceae bacterium]|nr:tRNA pseudouridine(55) synthase TruB [Desulfobacteraceae bacterium]
MRTELNGVIVLDKPAGITSAKAVAGVKRALGVAKVGHAGTLDPFATGVLVCCVGQATRLARFFLHGEKQYDAVLRLGITTDTLDITGQVVSQDSVPELSDQALAEVFNRFVGPQMQAPPVYSALKHQGTPLYKLARKGQPVQKAPRPITISALRIKAVALPEVRFEMRCSAGTYVRVLCADIGRVIGCGGHLAELRRTASCGFGIDEALSLEEAQGADQSRSADKAVIPMAAALRGMPIFEADERILQRLAHGQRLDVGMVPEQDLTAGGPGQHEGFIKVVDGQNRLRAVLQRSPDGVNYNYCCVFN